MGQRIHTLLTEAWHFVLLVVAVGLAAGKRGGHEVVSIVIALGVVGILSVFLATVLDPLGLSSDTRRYGVAAQAEQAELIHEEQAGLSPKRKAQFLRDDVLYGGGVLLVGLAVLIGYAFTWAGTPPANPFG